MYPLYQKYNYYLVMVPGFADLVMFIAEDLFGILIM